VDHDEAVNTGNWAYNSGVGLDPRDRIFRTVSQGEKYDPEVCLCGGNVQDWRECGRALCRRLHGLTSVSCLLLKMWAAFGVQIKQVWLFTASRGEREGQLHVHCMCNACMWSTAMHIVHGAGVDVVRMRDRLGPARRAANGERPHARGAGALHPRLGARAGEPAARAGASAVARARRRAARARVPAATAAARDAGRARAPARWAELNESTSGFGRDVKRRRELWAGHAGRKWHARCGGGGTSAGWDSMQLRRLDQSHGTILGSLH